MLKKILQFLKKLKFINSYNKNKIAIYYDSNSDIIRKYFNKNVTIIDPSKEIFLQVLLKSLFLNFFKDITHNYLKLFISKINPKLILTFIDNDINFYLLKNHFKKIIFVSIQNGIRAGIRIKKNKKTFPFEGNHKFKKKIKCDLVFCLNDNTKELYSKFIESKFVTLGSLKSNSVKIKKKSKKIIVSFVSQYIETKKKNEIFINIHGIKIRRDDFLLADIKAIKYIADFCIKRNLILQIIPRTNNLEEYQFYKNILNSKINFLYPLRKNNLSAYQLIDKSTIVTGIDSTLLFESLSRKKKVIFFSTRGSILSKKYNHLNFEESNFAWPLNLGDTGEFWTNIDNISSYEKISNYVYKISSKSWLKIINSKKYKKTIIPYNVNNKLLINELKMLNLK